MRRKIPLLFFLLSITLTSCSISSNLSLLKSPPTDFFVKVYKELSITRCPKTQSKPAKKNKGCEKKNAYSTGSGLMVRVSRKDVVVLTAGHVCETEGLISEDEKYKYSWTSVLKLLDKNRQFHDAQIILSTPGPSAQNADLCTLFVPSLDYIKNKSKVTIAHRAPITGEDVYYIGAPQGIYHPPTALVVRGTFSGPVDKYSSLISASAAPGASGSAVLSLNNQIYGVLFAVHPDFQTATIVTNYNETKKFLEATRKLLKK
jgi:hypothetical protein